MNRFEGSVAIVTGAARGIGRACAEALAQEGAVIVAVDVSTGVSDAGSVPTSCWHGVVGDITAPATVEAVMTAARDADGTLNVLINAAFWEERADLLEGTDDGWLRTFSVSTVGAVRLACEFARQVHSGAAAAGTERGAVVNVASIHAHAARPQFGAYSAAKAALVAFTRTAAVEWGPTGVRVNAVAPGFVQVERNAHIWQGPVQHQPNPPLRRGAQPHEIARVVAFLASSDASYVTGAVLPVDGGLLAQLPEEFRS